LGRHNIKCVAIPPTKISGFLPKFNDDLGLRTPGIYSIPCKCGNVYIGQTEKTTGNRIKEHQHNTRLLQTYKSALWNIACNMTIKSCSRIKKFSPRYGTLNVLL
jgi:hypothetical protein